MVVKAAKNHYYHFSLNCSQIIRKRRKKHKILCFFRRFYLFRALSLFWVEHVLGKDEVAGSNPANSSKRKPQDIVVFSLFSALFYTIEEKHKINSKHGSKHFLQFLSVRYSPFSKIWKAIFQTVKIALKLPFSGSVANNSKQLSWMSVKK